MGSNSVARKRQKKSNLPFRSCERGSDSKEENKDKALNQSVMASDMDIATARYMRTSSTNIHFDFFRRSSMGKRIYFFGYTKCTFNSFYTTP